MTVQAGRELSDPYRWLEAGAEDPAVAAFITAQNDASAAWLAALPGRDAFRQRLAARWDHPRRGAPWQRGDWWFQLRNDGLQDQDVLWCAPADDVTSGAPELPADAAFRPLLDPNTWTDDGTASLTGLAVRDDGAKVAFARSDAGSDWLVWDVVDTASGEAHGEPVRWARFSGAAWLPDGSGFLYGAYPPPPPGEEHASVTRGQRLQCHRLGTDPADDEVVYDRSDHPEWGFEPHVSHDGRFVVLEVWHGTHPTNRIHVAPIDAAGSIGAFRPLLDAGDARYEVVGVLDDELILATDRDAPLGRVVAVGLTDLDAPTPPALRELVPEAVAPATPPVPDPTAPPGAEPAPPANPDELGERLERVTLVGGDGPDDPAWLVCRRLRHAASRLAVHDARDGSHRHDVALPDPVTVPSVTGGRRTRAIHLTVEGFAAPQAVLHHDLVDRTTTTVTVPAGPSVTGGGQVVVSQVRVHHDGVAVPLFLVHRDDVRPDGRVPTILWGYGGFDIAVTPAYRPGWDTWVDAGGLLAVACLRGGGEYGRTWYDDGRRGNKQHVFDDALACAAWLTGRDRDRVTASALCGAADPDAVWTAPSHLGVEGRSNGGLLVGACLTQAPEAFGSAVPEVGVLDLTRFHRFTIGWAWTSDYGDPDDPADLEVLLRYSPYHRLVDGTHYPPTLITTGDTDDRVVPLHSFKFAAALQHAQGGPAPVLLRVDVAAGHGAGKPVGKLLDERADVLAFHAHHLGLIVAETPRPDERPGDAYRVDVPGSIAQESRDP